jgi:hypothetical protein
MVNVCPLSLRRTPDTACYIPLPFVGDPSLPNDSRVIPNIATDIIPFIYPLYEYESVSEYLKGARRPGQLHYEVAQSIKYGKPSWKGIFW